MLCYKDLGCVFIRHLLKWEDHSGSMPKEYERKIVIERRQKSCHRLLWGILVGGIIAVVRANDVCAGVTRLFYTLTT